MTSRLPDPIPTTIEGARLLEAIRAVRADVAAFEPAEVVVDVDGDVSSFTAADHNMVAWTCDPALATGSGVLTAGTLYVLKAKAATVGPIVSIIAPLAAASVSATLAKLAVFDAAGALLGVTATQHTAFNAGGTVTAALTTPTRAIVLGEVLYIAIISVGGTGPTLRVPAAAAPALNLGLSAAQGSRVGILASQTDMPGSLTLSGLTANTTLRFLAAAP